MTSFVISKRTRSLLAGSVIFASHLSFGGLDLRAQQAAVQVNFRSQQSGEVATPDLLLGQELRAAQLGGAPPAGLAQGSTGTQGFPGAQGATGSQGSSGLVQAMELAGVRTPLSAPDIRPIAQRGNIFPEDQAAALTHGVVPLPNGEDRGIACLAYRWQAANVHYGPLYFEEPMLERHGQECVGPVVQPALSAGKFLGNVALMPYKATLHRPLESRYALGHFRPGSPAPMLRETLPWSTRAALVQAGAVTGVAVGLPW
jgi:hypothetical protein